MSVHTRNGSAAVMEGRPRYGGATLVLLCIGVGAASGQPPADFARGVFVRLGRANEDNGLHLSEPGFETKTRVAEMGGLECRATDKADRRFWMNFTADREYLAKETNTGHALEVSYFDAGKGPLTLMYRAKVRGTPTENHLRIAQRTGTNTWKWVRVSLPDANFVARMAGRWVFRLSGEAWPPNQWEDLYISEVRLDRKGVWLTAVPDALAMKNPEPCTVSAQVTDEAGEPVKERVAVKFEVSAGRIGSEATTREGTASVSFVPPARDGDVEIAAKCDRGEAKMKLPVLPGSGKVLLRKRSLGFEPEDPLDVTKSRKYQCERLELSSSETEVLEGVAAVKMDYTFGGLKAGQPEPEATVFVGKAIPGRLTALYAEAHSEAVACEVHFILKDANGQEFRKYGGTLWRKGWADLLALMDSPPIPWLPVPPKPLKCPVSLEHVLLSGKPNYEAYQRSGTVYFDWVTAEFLVAESELPPVPFEVGARQEAGKLLVTLKNVSQEPCKARVNYWLTRMGPLAAHGTATRMPVRLQAGEVVEFSLTFPDVKEPGEYTVDLAAVDEKGDFVETRAKWTK